MPTPLQSPPVHRWPSSLQWSLSRQQHRRVLPRKSSSSMMSPSIPWLQQPPARVPRQRARLCRRRYRSVRRRRDSSCHRLSASIAAFHRLNTTPRAWTRPSEATACRTTSRCRRCSLLWNTSALACTLALCHHRSCTRSIPEGVDQPIGGHGLRTKCSSTTSTRTSQASP